MNNCDDIFKALRDGSVFPDDGLSDDGLSDGANRCRAANGDLLIHCCQTMDQLRQLAQCLTDIDVQGAGGMTPLAVYSDESNSEFCEIPLSHGANPNSIQPGTLGPLHRASHPSIIEMLIKASADIEAERGTTPLLFTAFHRQLDGMIAQAQHGANILAVDEQGNSAIHLAVRAGFGDGVRFCIEQEADVNHEKHTAQTPLFR